MKKESLKDYAEKK